MLSKGLGGYVTFTDVRDRDGKAVAVAYPAWATDTDYELDQVVTTGAGADLKHWKCLLNHESDNASTTGLESPTADNTYWKEVNPGTVMALFSWQTVENAASDEKQVLDEKGGSRHLPTSISGSGTLLFGALDEDLVQATFLPGYTGRMTILPDGRESGKPARVMQANIQNRTEGADGETIREVPVEFLVSGGITRTTVA